MYDLDFVFITYYHFKFVISSPETDYDTDSFLTKEKIKIKKLGPVGAHPLWTRQCVTFFRNNIQNY